MVDGMVDGGVHRLTPPLAAGEGAQTGAPGRDLAAWAWLGLASLGIAGVMAVLLAVSRVPGIEGAVPWPIAFFQKGLIIHVVMSIVVWFVAAFAALTASLDPGPAPAPGWEGLGALAAALTALSLPCLLLPAFLDRGEPSLNNYVPVIGDPLYFAGLLLLSVAVLLAALRPLMASASAPSPPDPVRPMMRAAGGVLVIALICFFLAAWQLRGTPPGYWYNEHLMWGGGHVMQFANVALMVAGWSALLRASGGPPSPEPRTGGVIALILVVCSAPALLFYALFPPFSGPQMDAFSQLKYLAGIPAAIAALAMVRALPRPWPWRSPWLQLLALSLVLFLVGGLFGIVVDGADTRTPAHYHGMIAGVSLALMGVFFVRLLPALGRPQPSRRAVLATGHLFGWGQLVACIGLFVAGGYGAPRKVAGEAQGMVDLGALIGLGLNGLGGLIAVAGGIVFVVAAARALLAPPSADASVTLRLTVEHQESATQSHQEGERR